MTTTMNFTSSKQTKGHFDKKKKKNMEKENKTTTMHALDKKEQRQHARVRKEHDENE